MITISDPALARVRVGELRDELRSRVNELTNPLLFKITREFLFARIRRIRWDISELSERFNISEPEVNT